MACYSSKPSKNPAMIVAQTPRLVLKQFSLDDVDGFFALNNDPVVLQYTGDQAFKNKQQVADVIKAYDHYDQYGFGRWSVYLKQTNQYIGFCGLKYSPELDETDIGFRIMRQHWGKGYATEAAQAALNIAFVEYQTDIVIARAMKDNQASQAVIKKMAMIYQSTFVENHIHWLKYAISQQDWNSKGNNQ